MDSLLGTFIHGEDDPWNTFGTEDLCIWYNRGGGCMIQTRRPEFARKLFQRSDTRLAGEQVHGDYLRIFSISMQPWQVRRLVSRYLQKADQTQFVGPTNEGFDGLVAAPMRVTVRRRVRRASRRFEASTGHQACQTRTPTPHPDFSNDTGSNSDSQLDELVAAA